MSKEVKTITSVLLSFNLRKFRDIHALRSKRQDIVIFKRKYVIYITMIAEAKRFKDSTQREHVYSPYKIIPHEKNNKTHMALFHYTVLHGTVWYSSLVGGFPLVQYLL